MKNIIKKLDKNILVIFILAFAFFTFFSNNNITSLTSFDNQALLTWNELAQKGYLPYRDIYYPYGILYFFKSTSFIFNILYITLLSTITTGLYLYLKKIIKNPKINNLATLGILLFIIFHIDIATFSRYGAVLIILISYCYFFYSNINLQKKYLFLYGIINGLFFSLIYDQGIASILFFFLLLITAPLLQTKTNIYKKITNFVKDLFIFCLGIFVGAAPLMYYLIKTNSLSSFIFSIIHLGDTIYYAKAPFFNFLSTPANLIIMVAIFLSIWIIIYHFYTKLHQSFLFYSIFYVTILLVFLQMKSIIRSISNELTFIAVILLFIDIIYLNTLLYSKKTLLKVLNIFSIIIFIVTFFTIKIIPIHISIQNTTLKTSINNDSKLNKVISYLTHLPINSTEQIYSYPGNPIIYLALNKKLPYYFSTYEASPRYAQDARLALLKEPKTTYVVVDTNMLAIQDGVPEYVRSNRELKYILTNFHPIKQIDNYIILKRSNDENILSKNLDYFNPKFRSYLINIDLKNIPNTQGKYMPYNPIISFTNTNQLETYVKNINKDNDIMLAFFANSKEKTQSMTISNSKITSHISFYSCNNNPCLINLSKIPLFYMSKENEKLKISFSGPLEKIDVFTVKSNTIW
ncbi:hypothetical protein HZA75_02435 [Candidatus Roizmanbacteria bacterium]|nr:hypothetical protein [Candidatus Roizmanbacteria bacterium]